jgi:hypothetical protein
MEAFTDSPESRFAEDGATFTDYEPPTRFGQMAKTLAECRVDHATNYIIKGVLAPRDLALIFGQPGAGKSLLGPLLAHAAATGRRVFGRRTRACRVLYIAAEAPGDLEARFVALRQQHGDAENLHLLAVTLDLQDPESDDLDDLRTYIARLRPDLIFIDTLAAAFPGLEENEARDMGRAAQKLRLLGTPMDEKNSRWKGAAVAAVHHAPKSGDTPRGHGNLNANADVTMRIEGQDAQPRSVTFGKNRNGPSGHAFDFGVEVVDLGTDQDGDPITRPVAVEALQGVAATRPDRRRGLTSEEQGWLKDIVDLFAEPGIATEGVIPRPEMLPVWGATREQIRAWLQVRGRIGVAPGVALTATERSTLGRYLNRLRDKGKIGIHGDWLWLL